MENPLYLEGMNYYIMQVATGREAGFIQNVHKLDPDLAARHNFIYLTRELTIRRKGQLLKEQQPMFSSYIIVETAGEIDTETLKRPHCGD